MDIYCNECGNNIGLQTNEEFNRMKQKLDTAIKALELAEELLESQTEEACRYDHHRNCQGHGWFGLEGDDCPVETWRQTLKEIKGEL